MKGANEYYDIFKGKSQQIGRLYFQIHSHARGKCFEIYLVPKGTIVKGSNIGSTKDAVEVYGMMSGQRGWTEEYGWKHKGKWVDDFNAIISERRKDEENRRTHFDELQAAKKEREENKTKALLDDY